MKKYKNIVYVESIYSLMLFFLIEKKIEETLYIFPEEFPKNIMENLRDKIILKKFEKNRIKIFRYIRIRIFLIKLTKYLSKIISEKQNFYFQDHLKYSQYFFNNYSTKFLLLEDGTLNYKIDKKLNFKISLHKKLKRNFVYLAKKVFEDKGQSKKVKKIFLTGILPIPKEIKEKVEIVNIEKSWRTLSEECKIQVLKIFNLNLNEIEILKEKENKILLITQPLSEDKIITEIEKIEMYKNILKERNIKKVFIKPHPREKTDYKKVLEDFEIEIIPKNFPIEFFLLFNIKFINIITIFSTAVFNLRNGNNIEFIGTKKYPKLYEKFGEIEIKK